MPISEIVEHFPYLGLFILLLLGLIGPFPEDTTLILCGFLIAQKVVSPIPALIVVYLGVLMTDYFLYYAGKKYGRAVISLKRVKKIITPERVSFLEEKFKKRGIALILLGRHVVGLRSQLFVVAGIMRMPAAKFLLVDAFSSMFTIAVMAGAGYMGGYNLQVIESDAKKIEYIAAFSILMVLAIYLLFRYFKVRQ